MPNSENVKHYEYSPEFIACILNSVKTIALVGASANETKPSNDVLWYLHELGYDMLPVNPNRQLAHIRGIRVFHSLDEIDRSVDMVDVFRPKREFHRIAEEAVEIGAKVLWGQLGIYDDLAATLAEAAGMKVVMDRCPKIELRDPRVRAQLDKSM